MGAKPANPAKTDVSTDAARTDRSAQALNSSWLGILVAVAMAALGWGLFLGDVMLGRSHQTPLPDVVSPPRESETPPHSEHATDSSEAASPTQDTLAEITRADFLLQFGSAEVAYKIYLDQHPRLERAKRGWLTYRLALACELLGDTDQALVWYQRLQREAVIPEVRILADVSRARVAARSGKLRESQYVLRGLDSSPEQVQARAVIRGAILHTLAYSCAREAIQENAQHDMPFVDLPPADLSASQWMELFQDESSAAEIETPQPHFSVVLRIGPDVEQTYVSCYVPSAPLSNFLRQLTTSAGGHEVTFSERATRRLSGTMQTVFFENASIAACLDGVLEPLDICWTRNESQLFIRTIQELDPKERRQHLHDVAQRITARALVSYPEHQLVPSTKFLQGSLEFHANQLESAMGKFKTLVDDGRHSPNTPAIWLNLATINATLGQTDEAIKAYFLVVDTADDPALEAMAYLRVGELRMACGEYEESLRPLIRAVTVATGSQVKARATLVLADTYRLLRNHYAAHTTLVEGRAALQDDRWRHWGELMEGLAASSMSEASHTPSRQQHKMFSALARIDLNSVPFDAGWLLLGDAYQSLGLTGEMVRVLGKGLEKAGSSHFRGLIRRRLVEHFIATSQFDAAKEMMQPMLSEDSPDPNYARLQLASIENVGGRFKECIALCRAVLEGDPTTDESAKALQLMGEAYESDARYDQAALCFAGLLPPAD